MNLKQTQESQKENVDVSTKSTSIYIKVETVDVSI